jgi:acyl-CoA thioester hydrolase
VTALPRVVIRRKVEWVDTDAAGHHHHGAVLRWAEAAECELLTALGQSTLFGRIPRVHYEADYRARLWFGQDVDIELGIVRVGERSLHYEFEVRAGDVVAATGKLSITLASPDSPSAVAWPDDVRKALLGTT